MLQALDDAAAGQWCRAAVAALSAYRYRLDDLNVFPVPDGDTGTNLLLTLEAALAACEPAGPAAGAGATGSPDRADDDASTWLRLARGAVRGARGNSGTILAQLLHSLADQLGGQGAADGPTVAAALRKAAEAAYAAVAHPEEGTVLTVARRGAESALAAVDAGRTDLADVVRAAADGARAALEETPNQLAVLRRAGVVDAGGAGLCVVLDALVTTVTGVEPERPELDRRRPGHHPRPVAEPPPGEPTSEVQFLLAEADADAVARLHDRLDALGDSLVIVGIDGPAGREWNVHIHVADVGAAVEAGIEAGRPYRISVLPLVPVRPPTPQPGRRAVVAIVPGNGLAELFVGEGVRVVPCGPGGVSDEDVLGEIVAAGAQDVVVLPNDAGLTELAARVATRAREQGCDVAVIPTRSPVQGLAAIAVADPERRYGDDVIAMAEAAAATRWAEVTFAEQEALTSAGRCQAGDVLGSAEGDVVVIGQDLAAVSCDLLDRLLSAGGELATVVVGTDAALGDAVCAHLAAVHPTVEVTRYEGAPDGVPLLVGVE